MKFIKLGKVFYGVQWPFAADTMTYEYDFKVDLCIF